MAEQNCDWINYGNLSIGIGTFILAIILGITTIISNRKSRKIHIADKRQDWIINFRKQIAEILTLQQQLNLIIKDCSLEELETLLMALNLATNEIRFMFPNGDKRRNKLEDILAEIMEDFKNKSDEKLAVKQYQIIQITDFIINKQRIKIVELDNSEPII